MVTADEIGRVKLFAALSPDSREKLARAAADVTLVPGDYAAPQGSERALFGVLDGHIEAVSFVDGIENVVGHREPGDFFGEVPIVLGTVFPVGFRATVRTRVLRLSPQDYHLLAADAPEIAQEVGRMASNRLTGSRGLQALAAAPPKPRAIVAGHRWDGACTELRHFLDRNQISFTWVQPDEAGAAEAWGGAMPVEGNLPAIRIPDGDTVARPQLRRVANLLGLTTEAPAAEYDVVIVGAGPAGLAAGVYGSSEGLSTIVIERHVPGGQAGTSSRIENYLGFPMGVSGEELANRALRQAKRLGATILVTRTVARLDARTHEVHLDGGDVLRARTIILACGVAWRQLAIEGLDGLVGKGVSYGAAPSEAPNSHGLDVHIVGAGNSAGQAALLLSTHARTVTILCRGEKLEKSMSHYLIDQLASRSNIRMQLRTELVAAHGTTSLEAIEIRDCGTGVTTQVESGSLFIMIGADVQTAWLPPEIALDRNGFVLTGPDLRSAGRWTLDRDPYLLETSVPGIFACGDVRLGAVKRVAAAVGEGSMSIAFVHQYLRDSTQ